MMKRLCLGILFFYSVLFGSDMGKEHLFVISGVVVNSNSSQKIENFIQMIENKSGYKLKPFYVSSYTRLSEVLRQNPDALGWTCGAPYVEDSLKDGQQLIALPLFNGTPTYSSFIVTRRSEKANRLSDFKNRVFAYSDLRSNSGYVAPATILKRDGFDIKNFFRVSISAGSHEKSIEAINRGLADVGAIDEYVWVEYTRKRPHLKEKLHVIERVGPFPFTPIVAGKDVNKKTVSILQKTLVGMDKKELMTFKKEFSLDGFVVKDKAFFEPIKKNMLLIGVDLPEKR